jgi:hypothetical protein
MSTSDNPYETPAASSAPPASARQQLLPVAIGLLATGILHVFGWLFFAAYVYSVAMRPDMSRESAHGMIVLCLYYGITMLYSLVLISGAFSMLRQGSYLWAMTTCVLALVPILGPCYVIAIPFGIWGLIVLRRPAVRAAFARM